MKTIFSLAFSLCTWADHNYLLSLPTSFAILQWMCNKFKNVKTFFFLPSSLGRNMWAQGSDLCFWTWSFLQWWAYWLWWEHISLVDTSHKPKRKKKHEFVKGYLFLLLTLFHLCWKEKPACFSQYSSAPCLSVAPSSGQ